MLADSQPNFSYLQYMYKELMFHFYKLDKIAQDFMFVFAVMVELLVLAKFFLYIL